MLHLKKLLFASTIFLTLTINVFAQTVTTDEGLTFPKTVQTADNISLQLNGIGYRKVTIFKIRVYAAALYLPSISKNSETILNRMTHRRLFIRFMHDVSSDDMQDAFVSNFLDNNEGTEYESKINSFAKNLPAVVEGDSLQLDWSPQGIVAQINGKIVANDSNTKFGDAVLRIWLGTSPPNGSLQRDMLSAHPG